MHFQVGVLAIALAAIAQAEPEADPANLYGAYYAYHDPYYGYGAHYGSQYGSQYGAYGTYGRIQKREAEADPQLVYANTAFPYVTAPAAFTGVGPVVYNSGEN